MPSTYPTYLVHFNKNHDSKNGQFTFGDGDGDGNPNDHSNTRKNRKIQLKETYKSAKNKSKKDWTAEEQYAVGNKQEKRAKAFLAGAIASFGLASAAMATDHQAAAAAFVSSFMVMSVSAAVNDYSGKKNMRQATDRKMTS